MGKFRDPTTKGVGPGYNADVVTPHDTNALSNTARALYVGTSGDVKLDTAGGDSGVTFTNVPAAAILPVWTTCVYATGTTASNIVALY